MLLTAQEARVLGSLVEKELTTPDQYPLTVKSLLAACNQASNRDPVVDYDEGTVMAALDSLKAQRLIRFVLPSHGRTAVRYRHVLDEALGQGRPEVFNTDQGVQITAEAFTSRLLSAGVAVSMDGKGRCLDNIFVERLWRSVKYEEIYLRCHETVPQLIQGFTDAHNSRLPRLRTEIEAPRRIAWQNRPVSSLQGGFHCN